MKRINWPFAVIVIWAILGILMFFVFWDFYAIPGFIRWHFADFSTAAAITFIPAILANLLTPVRARLAHPNWFKWLQIVIAVLATIRGLLIEREDLVGEADDGFDPGALFARIAGRPNTDVFDWVDVWAIALGGLLVIVLQWLSTRDILIWRRFLLLLQDEKA